MTEPTNNPGEQTQSSPAVDWEGRFKGMVPVVDRLTAEKKSLEEKVAALTSELEQARAQLALKDTEKTAAVGERDKQLQDAVKARTELETELGSLRALQMKVKVAKKLNRPDLMAILDTIPNMTDEGALETTLTTLANYADNAAKARADQLMAGVTPPISTGVQSPGFPTSEKEWTGLIESKPLGSPERQKAWDDYYSWLEKKHTTTR